MLMMSSEKDDTQGKWSVIVLQVRLWFGELDKGWHKHNTKVSNWPEGHILGTSALQSTSKDKKKILKVGRRVAQIYLDALVCPVGHGLVTSDSNTSKLLTFKIFFLYL